MQIKTLNTYLVYFQKNLIGTDVDGRWQVQKLIRETIKANAGSSPSDFQVIRNCEIVVPKTEVVNATA